MRVMVQLIIVSLFWSASSFGMLAYVRPSCGVLAGSPLRRTPVLPPGSSDDEDFLKKECIVSGPDEGGNFSSLLAIYEYLKVNPAYRGEGFIVKEGGGRLSFKVFELLGSVCVTVREQLS